MKRGSQASSSTEDGCTVCKKVWHAGVPPKVRNFAWRALHNAVPVKENLKRKHVDVDPICPRCGEKEESVDHLLLTCSEAQVVWYASPLRLDTSQIRSGGFWSWVVDKMKLCREAEWWDVFWMLCWSL